MNGERGGKVNSSSWNTKRLSKDKLREHLEETRLIDELGWASPAGSLEDTVPAARRKVVAECDHSMPRREHEDRSSCVVRREELFTLEELKRAGGRLKAKTAPGIDGVPNKILKEVIGAYPEILLEAFNSCLREGRFFVDWKKQRLVLLRKEDKPLQDASSYRPICLLDTMAKLLEEMILQRLQGLMVAENGLSENQFGFRKGSSTVYAIQAVVDIATKARRGTGKRKVFCALISIDIRNAFNTAR